jgi:tetratricopeptide (TPR) repeat protein
LGTLSYLSPEQAAGKPGEVDERTDVYALGIMLFEALTGSLPFDTTGRPSQVIQRILETEPTRPTSLSGQVDADLETILLKALEKDKGRRYQSAKELAEDFSRYLEGEPILARRPSSLYVLRKRLRKHRLAVAIGSVTVVLMVFGLMIGGWWREHSRERELTEARRETLRIQRGLESQIPSQQLGHAQGLIEQHPELPEAQLVWAQTLHKNEQQYAAIAFLENVPKAAPSRWACRALLAELCRAAGDAERADAEQARAQRDAPDTAEAWYLRSFATLEPAQALEHAARAVQRQPSHVLAQERLTWLRLRTGDLDGALQGADRLIELGEDSHAWTMFKGLALTRQGRFQEAIEAYTQVNAYTHLAHTYRRIKEYEKAVECYTKLIGPEGEKTANVWHFYQRATPLWILGRTEEALEDYRRVRVMLGRPYYSDARQYIILRESGRQDEAERVLSDALGAVKKPWLRRVFKCLAGQLTPEQLVDSPATQNKPEKLCEAYYYAGEACLLEDQLAEAREWFEQCVQTGVEFDPDASPETPMNEYELAQWRLDSLSTEESPTSRP